MIDLDIDQLMVTQAALMSYLEGLKSVEPAHDHEFERAKSQTLERAERALLAITLDIARKS